MNILARSLIVLSFLCGSVLAATTVGNPEPASGTWRVYRGSGFTTFVCQAASEEAAKACAAQDAQTRATSTRYQIRYPNRYLTITYSPDAPPPVNCAVSDWSAWAGEAWGTCTNGSQTRQETRTRTIVTPPANGGTACPALSETRTATQACTVPPPPTTGWTHCANQEQLCSFTGTRRVRYGADTRWIEREFNNGTVCNSTAFGGNPAQGALKTCQLQGATPEDPPPPPPPTGTGTIALSWRAPTQNEDGTQLTNLAGYRAYCTQGGAVRLIEVLVPVTTAVIDRLATGPWICYATAFNSNGTESMPSSNVTKVIQ